jgi:hypothetical protein
MLCSVPWVQQRITWIFRIHLVSSGEDTCVVVCGVVTIGHWLLVIGRLAGGNLHPCSRCQDAKLAELRIAMGNLVRGMVTVNAPR